MEPKVVPFYSKSENKKTCIHIFEISEHIYKNRQCLYCKITQTT